MPTITREDLVKKLEESNGHFVTVEFIKRGDGKKRVLNGRIGVRKGLVQRTTQSEKQALQKIIQNRIQNNLFSIFDVKIGEYRAFGIENLLTAKIGGEQYEVADVANAT